MTLAAIPDVSPATLRACVGPSLMTLGARGSVFADERRPSLTRRGLSALPPDVSGSAR